MTRKSITRADLAEAVYQRVPVTKEYASTLVEQVLDVIRATLETGESVKLSSFGIFMVRTRRERIGRNPKTNVEVPIKPWRAVIFSASPALKAHVSRASSLSANSTCEGIQRREEGHCDPGI